MLDLSHAIVVDFPLRGEWTAWNTPARRIPSHGTDFFGQRFAIDLFQFDWTARRPYATPLWRHVITGVPADAFFCWNQPVYAAFAGRVVAIGEAWPDRWWVHALWQLFRGTLLAPLSRPRGEDYRPLAGNFILLEGHPGIALYAHLRAGSISVAVGEDVAVNSQLARVGNSGNSTMPHLHFHVMDSLDPHAAAGRLCAFRNYERYIDGTWQPVAVGIPGPLERVRVVE